MQRNPCRGVVGNGPRLEGLSYRKGKQTDRLVNFDGNGINFLDGRLALYYQMFTRAEFQAGSCGDDWVWDGNAASCPPRVIWGA